MRKKSLSFRLLVTEGVVLAIFFTLVAIILEKGFLDSAEQALRDRLQVQVYALLSAAKLNESGELVMPHSLPEPRFETPGSGLYGFIQQAKKNMVWRSQSAIGLEEMLEPVELSAGKSEFVIVNHHRYAIHSDVILKNINGIEREFIFTVTEDTRFVSTQIEHLRNVLRIWLLVIGVSLIFIQFELLHWSLKPLRNIVDDLNAVDQGHKNRLDGHYATELTGLANNLNAFIVHERAHLDRYRKTLDDLAHSLKTPLAILQGCIESFSDNKGTVQEQISRMNQIIEYQLQKAAAKAEVKAIKSIDICQVIMKIKASLDKVYIDKGLNLELAIPEQHLIYYEEGDLYEVIGNLMDNACKWCHHSVKVTVNINQRKNRRDFSVLLLIEDDGPGIPIGKFNEILKRGMRLDENIDGHGIGVTVVYELINLLGGTLEGGTSAELGGMRWRVYLP
ncbi:MAG: sensor histidine kinase [Methylococcales bacterium]|nr:MAG: sensor histidine kinase [Methylococcales bacterium]